MVKKKNKAAALPPKILLKEQLKPKTLDDQASPRESSRLTGGDSLTSAIQENVSPQDLLDFFKINYITPNFPPITDILATWIQDILNFSGAEDEGAQDQYVTNILDSLLIIDERAKEGEDYKIEEELTNNGSMTFFDSPFTIQEDIPHADTFFESLINDEFLIFGSWNFSNASFHHNIENMCITNDTYLVTQYNLEFERVWDHIVIPDKP